MTCAAQHVPQSPTVLPIQDYLLATKGKLDSAPCYVGNSDTPSRVPIRTLSAGDAHVCGIKLDGTTVCWGKNDYDQTSLNDTNAVVVSAGEARSCSLNSAGDTTCVGVNDVGQREAPNSNFRAIDVGRAHACGINTSGAPECWGNASRPSLTFLLNTAPSLWR